MCGVFGISNYIKFDLEERFGFENNGIIPAEFQSATYRPHTMIPTVSRNSPNKLVFRHWSIIPPWIKDVKDLKYPTFNARSETVAEKPTFRTAWKKHQRCLVIATEFYEYRDNGKGKKKTPFKFTMPGGEPFAMAGLYQSWNDIETVTIITSDPNHDSKDIHDRLPVVLAKEDEELWLDKESELAAVEKLLQPYPDGEFVIEESGP
jgi:putative SOS response-associated peptidase YedK